MVSNHYRKQRYSRENFIDKYLGGDGYAIDYFVVDKGHVNGAEIHTITDNGIIIIHNYASAKMVTKLIARRGQVERLYKSAGRIAPEWLLSLCDWHEGLGYNYK